MISCIGGFVNIYLKVIRKKIEQKISLCAETQRETVYNALILGLKTFESTNENKNV